MKTIFSLLYLAFRCGFVLTQNDVRMPPSMTGRPLTGLIYRSDDDVALACKGNGVPSVVYEWKKNTFELNQNQPNIEKGADGSITINNAAASDEGFYQCFARNQYGVALSNTVHIQRAMLDSASGTPTTLPKTVVEGLPFHIQADPRKSFPKPIYGWEMARDTVDKNPVPLRPSRRIQIAENGDLYFAYALVDDGLDGRLYRSTTYNPYLDIKAGGSYTRINVTRNPEGLAPFNPTLGFASLEQTVAVIGGSATLRCFFSGYPEPTITWTGPRNTLPIGRYALNNFNSELVINNIAATDQGDYTCTGSNTQGRTTHVLQIRVEAAPKFQNTRDGPYNANVTNGESVTFNCNAFAQPQANFVWLQNGLPLNTSHPPARFSFSNDLKSLTIRDVCRDCVDRESKTDLTVIQCNASNIHGYALGQGYLNVLNKTEVMIRGPEKLSVDFREQKHFVFQCIPKSDLSTPATVQWFKTEPYGDLVRNDLPYVSVDNEFLVIMVYPNCSSECAKYLGEYRCVGSNGYSQGNKTIALNYEYKPQQDPVIQNTWAVWKTILIAGSISLVLFLIGMCLGFRWKTAIYRGKKHVKLPNLPNTYERVDYDSVGVPLEDIGRRSKPRARSAYEHTGYDTIDQVLEDMAGREGEMTHQPVVSRQNSYESMDTPMIEAINRGRARMDESTKYDNMGYAMPLEEVKDRVEMDENHVHAYDSVTREFGNHSSSNDQSEAMNIYSDLSRRGVNSGLDLVPEEVNHYLDLCSKEETPYLDMGTKNVNPYLTLGQKDVNPYTDMVEKEMGSQVNIIQKDEDLYLDMSKKDMDPHLDKSPCTSSPPASTAKCEADYLVLKN